MKQFAVAIIGCGNVSRMHFEAYLPHPERIKIAAVCDSSPESVDEVRRVYGIEQGFVALEEMITQAEWEVAIVCTPSGQDNVKTIALLDGAYRSAEEQRSMVFHEGIIV